MDITCNELSESCKKQFKFFSRWICYCGTPISKFKEFPPAEAAHLYSGVKKINHFFVLPCRNIAAEYAGKSIYKPIDTLYQIKGNLKGLFFTTYLYKTYLLPIFESFFFKIIAFILAILGLIHTFVWLRISVIPFVLVLRFWSKFKI